MKKIVCVLLAVVCVAIAASGCGKNNNKELSLSVYNEQQPSALLYGKLDSDTVSGKEDKLAVSIFNDTGKTYTFDCNLLVEVNKDGNWYSIEYAGDFVYPVHEYTLEPSSVVHEILYLGNLDYKLTSGEYRIVCFIEYEYVFINFTVK